MRAQLKSEKASANLDFYLSRGEAGVMPGPASFDWRGISGNDMVIRPKVRTHAHTSIFILVRAHHTHIPSPGY